MTGRVGIHFGEKRVTIVEARYSLVRRALELPPADGHRWTYRESDVEAVLAALEEHFRKGVKTLTVVLPTNAIFFRRVSLPEGEANDEAIRFAAEPVLPLPLEQLHVIPVRRSDTECRSLRCRGRRGERCLSGSMKRAGCVPRQSVKCSYCPRRSQYQCQTAR